MSIKINQSKFDESLMRNRCILQSNDTVFDVFFRTINGLIKVEKKYQWHRSEKPLDQSRCYQLLGDKKLVLGTPILTNVGKEKRPTNACIVIPVDLTDDLEKIKRTIAPYYENGMGSGFDLNDLPDPIQMLNKLNDIALSLEKKGLERPTANIGTLRVDHPRIFEFIRHKRNANFLKWRFNLSVVISNDFMTAVRENKKWDLKDSDGKVTETVQAKDVFDEIVRSAHYCGEPGVLFMDFFNEDNPVPHLQYKSTAPCAEVALATGEACQFSYVNLSEFIKTTSEGTICFDFEKMQSTIKILVRILDDAVQLSIDNAIGDSTVIQKKRRIGVGVCGTADLFIKLGLSYEDPKAVDLMQEIMSVINYTSKKASVKLAKTRGCFPEFPKSKYKDNSWFFSKTFTSPTTKVTAKMWEDLFEDIQTNGLRNAGTCSLPPTGTSSRIVLTSSSIEPRFSLINQFGNIDLHIKEAIERILLTKGYEKATIQKIEEDIKQNGYIVRGDLPQKLTDLLKVSHQIKYEHQMRLMQNIAKYSDESVSKTVNLPIAATEAEVSSIIQSAYNIRLKGITVFRDRCLETRDLLEKSL